MQEKFFETLFIIDILTFKGKMAITEKGKKE